MAVSKECFIYGPTIVERLDTVTRNVRSIGVCNTVYFGLARICFFFKLQILHDARSWHEWDSLYGCGKYCAIPETLSKAFYCNRMICRFCQVDFATGAFSKGESGLGFSSQAS